MMMRTVLAATIGHYASKIIKKIILSTRINLVRMQQLLSWTHNREGIMEVKKIRK